MAEISPFQGIRYNNELIREMSAVICPSYDVISPQEQQAYHDKNEYNVIHIEHGIVQPDDTDTQNKYSRSRATLGEWLKKGILKGSFTKIVRPGDVITTYLEIESINKDKNNLLENSDNYIDVFASYKCVNQKGEIVAVGEASCKIDI